MQESRMAKPAGSAAAKRKKDLPLVAHVVLAAAASRTSSRAPISALPNRVQHACRPPSTAMLDRFYRLSLSLSFSLSSMYVCVYGVRLPISPSAP